MEEEQYASSRLLIYDFDKHGPMPTKQQLNAAGHLTNAFFSQHFYHLKKKPNNLGAVYIVRVQHRGEGGV